MGNGKTVRTIGQTVFLGRKGGRTCSGFASHFNTNKTISRGGLPYKKDGVLIGNFEKNP